MSLCERIAQACTVSLLDEYQLWQLVEKGMVSYWARKGNRSGLSKDDVVELKRGSTQEKGWYVGSEFIPIDEWLVRFREWKH